jgi:hypothetical protein
MQLLIAANAFRDEMIINQVMWTDAGIADGGNCRILASRLVGNLKN